MTIETKYNIADRVFLLIRNKVECYAICEVKTTVTPSNINISYKLQTFAGNTDYYPENELFSTKEELLKSL